MFDWFKKVLPNLGAKSKMQALPLTINAPEGVALQRALGRLLNLYSVKKPSAEIMYEIARFKLAVEQHGHVAPTNFTETEELIRLTRDA